VFVAPASAATIRTLQLDGQARGSFRVSSSPRRVADRDLQELMDAALRRIPRPNDRRVVAEWYSGMPRAEQTPAIRSLVASQAREVWVESWDREGGGSVWLVVDDTGRPLSRVVAPPASTLLAVGTDWTLWLWRDEFDVEHIRLHGLRR